MKQAFFEYMPGSNGAKGVTLWNGWKGICLVGEDPGL